MQSLDILIKNAQVFKIKNEKENNIMMKKQICLKALFIILCCSNLSVNGTILTSLQHWDPSPIYSSLNNKPANNHCLEAHTYNQFNQPEKNIPTFTITMTPVIQRAIRSQDDIGRQFGKTLTDSTPSNGAYLNDFRGLPFTLGLFLGADANGKYITGTSPSNAASAITNTTIAATALPQAIKNTLTNSGVYAADGTTLNTQPGFGAILYDSTITSSSTVTDLSGVPAGVASPGSTKTTLFCDETLYRVTSTYTSSSPEYLGCFSIPTEYMKAGLRFEINLNISKNLDLTIQAGGVQVQHKLLQPIINLTSTGNSTIYSGMWVYQFPTGVMTTGQTAAKDAFNDQITNNMEELLSVSDGIGFEYKDYNKFQTEDVRMCLSFKYPLIKNISAEAIAEEYQTLVFTPYAQIAGSMPAGSSLEYKNALEISSGNNGHFACGGTIGLSCDFLETIQIGMEAGYDYFFSAVHKNRPCPNNKYQKILYPYKRDIKVQPGANSHFSVYMSSYQFVKNINFYCGFEYLNHLQDTHTLVEENKYFIPEMLNNHTEWNSQMLTAGLNADITPDFNFGMVMQFPVSQRNAANTSSIGASLSFLF